MKVKELQKTVNVAWSPIELNTIQLAAGTAAQQIDTSISSNSVLEVYSANLADPGYDLELVGSKTTQYRFQKLVWSPMGINGPHNTGLIVGGCEGGHLEVYSASKLLAGEESLISHMDKHTGPVASIDFNGFQNNLLASGASESEIFIWDLNNTTTPMMPGTKTQPFEDIKSVAWNKQVRHILASVFSSRCVIWDLRKNEQIIKLSDTQSRVRWRSIQWHPEIATQLWLASEDDQAPFVQLWDLRYATAPTKTFQIHQRGILGLTWCPKDADLMVSCGKDNKIYCWNPNTEIPEGEILSEIATTIQWYSDVQWCPRNPALIASSSLDGNVSIYSVLGGSQQQVQTSNKIADSFPGMDQIAQGPVPHLTSHTVYSDLKKPPKWMKRPAGCSFGFGGRLVSYSKSNPQKVTISQVITEPDLVQRSTKLETTLSEGNFSDYCRQRADQMDDQYGRYIWYFLKANFEPNPQLEMLNLLGYDANDMSSKFTKYKESANDMDSGVDQLTNQMASLSRSDSSEVEGDQSTDDSTDLSTGDQNVLFDAIAAGNKTLSNQSAITDHQEYAIKTGEDAEGLICQAILSGNIEAAVEICLESGRPAEAIIIAMTGGSELLGRTQCRYLKKTDGYLSNIISALVTRDWSGVITQCTVESWKEALVAALTHSQQQMSTLCEQLGERLQKECQQNPSVSKNAILCFICAGNLEKLVDSWLKLRKANQDTKLTTSELQDLVEIVMLLQKSFELQGRNIQPTGKLADLLSNYAGLLASQGALDSALFYLCPSEDPEMVDLRERLYYALGHKKQPTSSVRTTQLNRTSCPYGQGQPPAINHSFSQQRPSLTSTSPQLVPAFNTGLPGTYKSNDIPTSQAWQTPALSQPPMNSYSSVANPGPPPVPTMHPVQQTQVSKPPLPSSVNDNLAHPPRPSSVGSQGSTPLSRVKYVLDPSVTSGPNYGQTNNFYNAPVGANVMSQPMNPQMFNTQPVGGPVSGVQQNQLYSNTQMSNNVGNYLPGVPPIEQAQQALPPTTSNWKSSSSASGWNDPPALLSTRTQVQYNVHNQMSAEHAGTRKWQRIINSNTHSANVNKPNQRTTTEGDGGKASFMFQKKSESSSASVTPITHPLFGVDPNQVQNGYSDSQNVGYQNTQAQPPMPGQGQLQPPLSSQQQQQPPVMPIPQQQQQQQQQQQTAPMQQSHYPNQMNFQTHALPQMYQSHQHQEIAAPPKPEPPKEKPPLPEEYIYLQTVFEELKNQCLATATDPRTKRKFIDVAKRLENLFDLIRENQLSPNTLASLNQIVQFIQNGNYQSAMGTYTSIVSGPDFAQTASFMTGIKVLVQSANELNVFLR